MRNNPLIVLLVFSNRHDLPYVVDADFNYFCHHA